MTMPLNYANDAPIVTARTDQLETSQVQYAPCSILYRRSLMLAFVSIAFDFKKYGDADNAIEIQLLIIAGFLFFSTIAIMSRVTDRDHVQYLPRSQRYLLIWFFFFAYIATITFLRGIPPIQILRLGIPYIAMGIGMLLVYRHLQANYDPQILVRNMILCFTISVFWVAYIGRTEVSTDVDSVASFLEDVRFSIISPALTLLLAWCIYHISRNKMLLFNTFIILVCITLIFISKTRGLITGFAIVAPFVYLARSNRKIASFGITVPIAFGLLVASFVLLTYFDVDMFSLWQRRLIMTQDEIIDITLYMRIAEYLGQMQVLFSDPLNALFGMGLYYETYWDPEITDILERSLGVDIYYVSFGNGVHSTYINSLFHGGLIAGWIPTYGFGICLWIAARVIMLNSSDREAYGDRDKAVLCMAIMPLLSMSFATLFIHRVGSFAVGIVVIYSYIQWERWQQRRRLGIN